MDADFWGNCWRDDALRHAYVLVDDYSFVNEMTAVRRMDGRVIRLVGRGGIAGSHVSGAGEFPADEVIGNDGTIMDLLERVLKVIEGLRV